MNQKYEHRPCPFCGERDEDGGLQLGHWLEKYDGTKDEDVWQVKCERCGAIGPESLDADNAWGIWAIATEKHDD